MGLSVYMLVWLTAACPWAAVAPTAVERALVYERPAYSVVELLYGYRVGSTKGIAVVGTDCQVYLQFPPLAETACHELKHCAKGQFHG